MQDKNFEEFKDIVKAGCVLGNSIEASYRDNELTLSDARHFIDDVPHLVRAAQGFGDGITAVNTMSDVQRKEIHEIIKETLEFEDEPSELEAELIAIKSFNFVHSGLGLYSAIKSLREQKRP